MTNAHNTREQLTLYAMQSLAVDESTAVSAHLRICSACRTDHAQVGVELALMGLVVQQRELPLGARERFRERVAGSTSMKPQNLPLEAAAGIHEISVERTVCNPNSPATQHECETSLRAGSAVQKKSLLSMQAPLSMTARNKRDAGLKFTTAKPAPVRVAAARIVNIF